MASNGCLPDSALSAIPGGRLAHEPARAWNAMIAEARRRRLPVPMPDGPASSYRTYAQQVQLKEEWTARGEPQNAATPGTSNHGLGSAVDCGNDAQQATIRRIGKHFGWADGAWTDAPWEDWHYLYHPGVWKPAPRWPFLPLREGRNHGKGMWVFILRARLRRLGYHRDGTGKGKLLQRRGRFDKHVHAAVVRFQRHHHLKADGIVGPGTWRELKGDARAKVKHAS